MQTKGVNRKDFIRGTVAGVAALLVGRLSEKNARVMESVTNVTVYDEPAIGQPGYEKRVAKLFRDAGLPGQPNKH